MKRIALILALLFSVLQLNAQTTKVIGVVVDAETGEPVPFAGLYFKGTTIGLTADIEGRFTIETRDPEAKILVCQLLGYETQEKEVKHGAFSNVEFRLKLTHNELPGAFVKADNRRIKRLLANIDAHRDRNDPDHRPQFRCNIYNKMELDLTHPREYLNSKWFNKQFGFVFDYMDTSVVSGVPYLPFMISESVVDRKHTANPNADSEVITANRVSGINPDANLLSQFTGSLHLQVNFYRPFINAFDIEFPSPVQKSGLLFYNYFIIDSLKVDGRKTYIVRYHPKDGISSPAFDGELQIDAEEFAVKRVKAKMVHGGNVNWVRDLVLESDYQRLPDSTWFYSQDKLYSDFSIALGDSSRVLSMIGNRQLNYTDLDFSPLEPIDPGDGKVVVLPDANFKDDAFWKAERPYQLTPREEGIYTMVDQVQDVGLYKAAYKIAYTLATSYYDIGPVGISISQLYSNNELEGPKVRFGMHTSKELTKTLRASGAIAYGFEDHKIKGMLTYEHLFKKEPQRKLTLDARYDVVQMGKGRSNITSDNFFTAMYKSSSRLMYMSNISACWEHEFSMNFNAEAQIGLQRYYSNFKGSLGPAVPIMDWAGNRIPSVAVNQIKLRGRLSWEETVNRGLFTKTYVHSDYPVIWMTAEGSVPGLREGDIGFFRPQVDILWRFLIPPLGLSELNINAGTIVGKVPWIMLQMFPGNATNLLDKTAFSCMDYFEFGADTWATMFWYHCFNGFFLGKIPLIRELNLREEFTAKIAYGTLSDKNNGTDIKYGAMTQFPFGMQPMNGVPYVELGAGVSNIFRVLRVDFIWRVTHRETVDPNRPPRLFTFNIGAELRF